MNLTTKYLSKEHYYALKVDPQANRYFLSIPVDNHLAGYLEYYELSQEEFDLFLKCPDRAIAFAQECRERTQDARLLFEPGKWRGTPVV